MDDGALDEAAAEWLFERENGFSAERERAFAYWCAEDARHAEAVRRVERTMELFGEMPAVRSQLETRLDNTRVAAPPAPIPAFRRMVWIGGIAAALVLGLIAFTWSTKRSAAPLVHYATDTAALRSLSLPDSSVMDINVGSNVTVQFLPHERRVTLQQGEAHFQVAHDSSRPFIVTAGNVSVRAVGTAFDVRMTPDAVDVVVVEGKVELSRSQDEFSGAPAEPLPLLVAGKRAQVARDVGNAVPKIEAIDDRSIHSLLTWQTPMASFTDVPLRDVIVRFNRRNTIQLVLDDAELGKRKIGGKIALDQVEAFVRLLEQDGDIVADRATAGRITLRRAH